VLDADADRIALVGGPNLAGEIIRRQFTAAVVACASPAGALTLVGIADRAKHKPSELSGGQEQRVGIARAIVGDPLLLLCDEPTGDLDRKSADDVLHLLQILNREHGKSIIMVTHDPKAAEFAGRQLHMDKGALLETGTLA